MSKKKVILLIFGLFFTLVTFLYFRRPIITGKLTQQTIYLSILNSFHIKDKHAEACFMLIDDDSGPGIFKIRDICERVGVKATFAVVPAFLDSTRCDSLRKWQQEGYGIALHSYDHGRWKDWTKEEVESDIDRSLLFLRDRGFETDRINLVVTPGFNNTRAIRSAIASKGMKMVMGANIVNPDTTTFQMGRLFVRKDTEMGDVLKILMKTNAEKGFIIFGSHSSICNDFSADKMEKCIQLAKKVELRQIVF